MKRIISVFAVIAVVFGAFAWAASGEGASGDRLRLKFVGNSEIGWVLGPDSPRGSNHRALNMALTGPTGTGYVNGVSYWLTPEDEGVTSVAADRVRNLSFDFLNTAGGGYVSPGAPRISVVFSNGLVVYLSAYYCESVLPGGTWSRADFTGQHEVGCGFYDSKSGDPMWTSDGTHSAWENFVAANPGLRVDYAVVVQDESDLGMMRARIDNIAMQNWMQTSATRVKECPTESSC